MPSPSYETFTDESQPVREGMFTVYDQIHDNDLLLYGFSVFYLTVLIGKVKS